MHKLWTNVSAHPMWVLRVAVAGEFLGHGVFALQGKRGWFDFFTPFGITDEQTMINILLVVGVVDILLAIHVLVRPVRALVLWMAFWGLFTALLRWPIGGEPIWDFFERWANWGAPLTLAILMSRKSRSRVYSNRRMSPK